MAGATTPGSHKALREAAGDLRKVICYQLGRKSSIVDKWMLPPPANAATRDANGIPNPLDHVIAIFEIAQADSPERADRMLNWLCRQCGGRFVRPAPGQRDLFPDAAEARKLLGTLEGEQKKKPSPARTKRLTALRRKLQNVVDLIDLEEGGAE